MSDSVLATAWHKVADSVTGLFAYNKVATFIVAGISFLVGALLF
jgi:hypothetical protein